MSEKKLSQSAMIPAPTVITAHANADFDALSSIIAAGKLYPDAILLFPGTQERAIQNLFLEHASLNFSIRMPREIDMNSVRKLIVVDTRQRSRIPHMQPALKNKRLEIHVYDHHPGTSDDLLAQKEVIKPWGATTSILVHEIKARSISLTSDEATMLGLGIYEDTGSFTFSSTTPYDYEAAAWLHQHGMNLNIISELVSRDMTPEQVAALHTLLESAQTHDIKGIPVIITEASMEDFLGDFSLVVQKMMEMTQAKAIFALANMADKVQIVARSRVPEVDVGKVCAFYGGGGHAMAAAASVKDQTMAQIKDGLFALLYSSIVPDMTVRQLMSSPVVSIPEDKSVKEASETMGRYGLKAIPITEPGTLHCVGLLEYQLAARAMSHGLGDMPLSEYMHRKVLTVTPESTLYPVTEIILGERQRLIPVVENNDIVGVITRTDLINTLVEEPARIPEKLMTDTQNRRHRNIGSLMAERLPEQTLKYLKAAGKYGDKMKVNVYAVGGFVRDILMNRSNLDLDLVVESDGVEFATGLAQELGGRIRPHYAFKTALLMVPEEDGKEQRIDIATARLEYYDHPAALPTVELSSIKMDLYRRDFTVNAVAVQLNEPHFGRLLDFFDSLRDLKDRTLRVLHSLSFVEDPTRILRAIRFERRFDFQLGSQTERLIKNAMHLNLIQKVSDARIMHEFRNVLQESNVVGCLERMEEFDILKAIHPTLKLSPKKQELLHEAHTVVEWYKLLYLSSEPEVWQIYLLCLCLNAKYPDVSQVTNRLGLTPNVRHEFLSMREKVRSAIKELKSLLEGGLIKSALHALLSPIPLEGILYMMARTENEEARKAISLYLTKLRDMKSDISGLDLMALGAAPGPVFGEILRKILEAKLDDIAPTRTTQLRLAASLLHEKNDEKNQTKE